MSGKRKKLLSPEEILNAIQEVADMATDCNVQVVLVGGAALHEYGSDRLTSDVDFISNDIIADLPNENELSFGGYQSHTPSGTPVDLIIRRDDYSELYEEALMFPRRVKGIPVPVASPEYMVAMKMAARRGKDSIDLENLLLSGEVNYAKARKIVKRLLGIFAADELDNVLQVAKWKRETGRE